MPSSATEAFYEGRGIPVELPEIERVLDELWGPAAEKAGGPELDRPAVTRVALANVVLVNLGPDRPGIEATISAMTTQYPSRLIVLRPSDDGDRPLSAEVAAQCHLPAPGRPQVCSERIVLRASPGGRHLLPGAVRALVESDLHCVLWWCDDPREAPELFELLSGDATRIILDLPDPGGDPAGLAAVIPVDRRRLVRDFAWFALTPWRRLIADHFDPPLTPDLDRIEAIRLRAIGERADRPPRAAAWLIAWLAGQLGWRPEGPIRASGPGTLHASMRSPSGIVAIELETEAGEAGAPAQVAELEISLRPGMTVGIRCDGKGACEVRTSGSDRSAATLPRIVKAPSYELVHQVSAALLSDRSDPPYFRALPIALWLLGAGDRGGAGSPLGSG